MNTPLIVLAAAALACGGAAAHFHTQLDKERARVAQLEARVAELEQPSPPPNPFVPAPPIPEEKPPEAAPARSVAQPAAAQLASNALTAAPSPRSADERRRMRERMIRERRALLDDPEYRKAMRMQHRMSLQQHYPDLAADLGITVEQADKLLDLLADQQMRGIEGLEFADYDPADPAQREQFERKIAERQREQERQIAEVLGSDGQQRWQDYQRTMGSRMRARQLRDSFAAAGMPLRDDQYTQLRGVLADRMRQSQYENQNVSVARQEGSASADQFLKMQEEAITRADQDFARSRDAVSHLLSSEQLEIYKQLHDSELAMRRAQLRLQRASMEAAQREGQDWRGSGFVGSESIE